VIVLPRFESQDMVKVHQTSHAPGSTLSVQERKCKERVYVEDV
jgi:hypothetical protein